MSERLHGRKVNATRDYRLFVRSDENRVINPKKHKKLERSMREYGFLSCYPIICFRDEQKRLIIKDGQHRLNFAETLGLPVYWIEVEIDFDVAKVNSTAKVWTVRDYAEKWAQRGLKPYVEGLEFSERHGLPIGITFAILNGTTTFGNVQSDFEDGTFKIKDRAWAESIAAIYGPITTLSADTRNAAFLTACMAVCRVPDFDQKRLLHNASRCRDKLVSYSTREAYLEMIEEVYNFGRKQLVGLKSQATMAMRERNATTAAKKHKAEKEAVSAA